MTNNQNAVENKVRKTRVKVGTVIIEYASRDGDVSNTNRIKENVLKMIFDGYEKRNTAIK